MTTRFITPVIAVFITAGAAPAQTTSEENRSQIETYRFNATVPVRECSYGGLVPSDSTVIAAPYGAKFAHVSDIVMNDTARVMIQFLPWKQASYEYRTFNVQLQDTTVRRLEHAAALRDAVRGRKGFAADSLQAADAMETVQSVEIERTRTFCVDKAIFDRTATRVYAKWSIDFAAGILLLPIKMRGGGSRDFDFSKDVTLGTVAGPRMRLTSERDVFASLLVGAGITAVTLDAENTGQLITESTDRAAVTITTGLMFEVNRFQLGLMLGWDHISNPNQNAWEYQGHRWLSIGLGYTLLSEPPRASPKRSQ